jgi:glycosyltransferase involved in cell wall biosynthesis
MSQSLHILAPTRYPWRFNSPRQSRHDISIRNFLPLNKISTSIEGVTVINPFPFRHFDLIHAFNRIPLGDTPFIIGFESHLPRAFGLENTAYFSFLSKMLVSPRCRAIIGISEFAKRQFLLQHKGRPWYEALAPKLRVRYPNIPIPVEADAFAPGEDKTVRLVFVGNHFSRKGGTVALRLAKIAAEKKFPLEVDIISSLEVGAVSWVDPTRTGYFDRDMALLRSLPNVRHHGRLPNPEVIAAIRKAHFLLLPTFSDTFGFSAIEAMANYTPVIATHQNALPEFIKDGDNGLVLALDNNEAGEWKHIGRNDRGSPEYESIFDNEVDRLAEAAYQKIESVMHSPETYLSMRAKARATAQQLFSATDANTFWDNLYAEVIAA